MKRLVVLFAITSVLVLGNVHLASAGTLNWQSIVGLAPATIASGFTDAGNKTTQAMASFGNYLYAGTMNTDTGTQVWRTSDGTTWTQANTSGFGDPSNTATISFAVFGNYLYAGTRSGTGAGGPGTSTGTQIWRTSDGTTWTNVVGPGGTIGSGFGDTETFSTNCLSAFGNYLYAGTVNNTTGTQVWRTSDGTTWTQANTSGFGDPTNDWGTYSMAVFGTYLYAGVGYRSGAQVWRTSDGTTWTQTDTSGFPAPNVDVRALAVFGDYLYAGTGYGAIAQIWRSSDGMTWTNVVGPAGTIGNGFGDPQTWGMHSLAVLGNYLYAGMDGATAQVWRSPDGINWTRTNVGGFGDTNNRSIHSLTVFGNHLYAGTSNNTTGTTVWGLEGETPQPAPAPQPGQLPYTGSGLSSLSLLGLSGMIFLFTLNGFVAMALGGIVLSSRRKATS